jgi:serine protease Do
MSLRTRTAIILAVLLFLASTAVLAWAFDARSRTAPAPRGAGTAALPAEAAATPDDLSSAFRRVAKSVRPSVVNIRSVQHVRLGARPPVDRPDAEFDAFREFFGDNLFERFFSFRMPDQGFVQRGIGTGVIVSGDGYILTNHHVVRDADEVTVGLSDNRTFTGRIVGADEKTDLAVVKIEASELVPAELGDSDQLEVGDWVLALGNPFGLSQTVTAGIVSAKGRANVGIADYEDFIQTDAAINPGNSGGPLVNLRGQVVGIATAIVTRSGGYMGVGFAIPINMARSIKDSILRHGRVDRGWLGVAIQDLSEDLSRSFGYEGRAGALVGDVTPDGPADRAGVRSGDIIVSFDGRSVENTNQLRNAVASTPPGRTAQLEVVRDGKRQQLSVRVGQQETRAVVAHPRGESAVDLGLHVRTLTPELARRIGCDVDAGVVVAQVEADSLAARAGIRVHDVITAVGSRSVRDVAEFKDAMEQQDLRRGVRLHVRTGSAARYVFLKRSP